MNGSCGTGEASDELPRSAPRAECGEPSIDGYPDVHSPNGTSYLCRRHSGCVQSAPWPYQRSAYADHDFARPVFVRAELRPSLASRVTLFVRALPTLLREMWGGTK